VMAQLMPNDTALLQRVETLVYQALIDWTRQSGRMSLSLIANTLKVEDSKVTATAHFVKDLGADELALVALVMACEREFKIDIPRADTETFHWVRDVVAYLRKRGVWNNPDATRGGAGLALAPGQCLALEPPHRTWSDGLEEQCCHQTRQHERGGQADCAERCGQWRILDLPLTFGQHGLDRAFIPTVVTRCQPVGRLTSNATTSR
jgi:acyl carrier protein